MFLPISKLISQGRKAEHVVAYRGKQSLTFNTFKKDVQMLVDKLPATDGLSFALVAKDSYTFAVSFFALLHARCSLILPSNNQPDTIRLLKSQGLNLLIDGEIELNNDGENIKNTAVDTPFYKLNAETCGIDFYTSGSTGEPKKVHKTLQQLEAEVSVLEELFGEKLTSSITVSTVTHQHIYGLLFKVLWPVCAGRPFVVETFAYWETLTSRMHQKYCIVSSPAHLERYPDGFEVDKKNAPDVVFCSGGPLSFKAAKETEVRLGTLPVEVFGSTETGGIAHRQQLVENNTWTPFNVVKLDEIGGVLQVQSPYLDTDEWHSTNDLVSFAKKVQFQLLGRNDRIVKVEGKRVSLPEIEGVLINHDWVEDAAALILDDARKSLVCVAVLNQSGEEERKRYGDFRFKQKIRTELHSSFELVTLPIRWRFVKQIPQNPQGKRLHQVLSSLFK